MDGRFFAVFIVLDILVEFALLVDGEDVPVTSMLVERIAVDAIRRLLGCQDKYRSRPGVGVLSPSCLLSARYQACRELANIRSWFMGCETSCEMLSGALTAWLDHFFIEAP
jgi:hypothetical protein